jgi:phosphate-selective porin OprO/OprP
MRARRLCFVLTLLFVFAACRLALAQKGGVKPPAEPTPQALTLINPADSLPAEPEPIVVDSPGLAQMPQPAAASAPMLPPAAVGQAGDVDSVLAPSEDRPGSAAEPRKQPILLQATWDNGLVFTSDNKQFNIHVGGIGMIDTVWLIGPHSVFEAPGGGTSGVGNAQASLLRRAILQADGNIFDQFDYSIQFDFANASNENSGLQPPSLGNLTSSPAPLNIWMQVRDVPWLGYVRLGNQTKTIGMENNTSAAFLPFMERSDNNDAFYGPFDNGFSLGITAQSWTESERLTWRYGIFQPATNVFGVAFNKYTVGVRLTGLPWYEAEGERLIHVGLGYWGGSIVEDRLRDRVRPLLRNAPGFAVPVIADTGEIPGNKQFTLAPEFAMVFGPLTVQAEYAGQWLTGAFAPNGQPQGTVFYHGGYVEALYFLTGEYQPYERRDGVFGRVIPRHDYHIRKGDEDWSLGAWQIGARFSYVDLNDKAIQGGRVYDWTVGLNWYLNPNMKLQFNYVVEHRNMPGVAVGWINGLGIRAAYDF